MDPSLGVGALALVGVIVTAWLQYKRGDKADKALSETDAVKVSQHGLINLVEQLRTEVNRYKLATAECESECREIRDENAELLDQVATTRAALRGQEQVTVELQNRVDSQARLVATLQARVAELEGGGA